MNESLDPVKQLEDLRRAYNLCEKERDEFKRILNDVPLLKRHKMPDTRSGTTRKLTVGAYESYVTVNFFDNSQPGEVFILIGKQGSTLGGMVDQLGTMASVMLQYGIPWERIQAKWLGTKFEPHNDTHSSLLDAYAKNIAAMISDFGGNPAEGCSWKRP